MSYSNRRSFLKTVAVGFVGTYAAASLSLPLKVFAQDNKLKDGIEIYKDFIVLDARTQKTLMHLEEVILPGSRELGIHNALMKYYSENPGIAGFIDSGLWKIESLSKNKFEIPFQEITDKKKLQMLFDHLKKSNNSRNFFNKFREKLYEFYFLHPKILNKLNYDGPPQPKGFMDYNKPPKIS